MMPCKICGKEEHSDGLCEKHYFKSIELKARQRFYEQRPESKARQRAYRQRPEVKVRQRAYNQRPEVKAWQRAYNQRPGVKERHRVYARVYSQRPQVKEKRRAKQLAEKNEKLRLRAERKKRIFLDRKKTYGAAKEVKTLDDLLTLAKRMLPYETAKAFVFDGAALVKRERTLKKSGRRRVVKP